VKKSAIRNSAQVFGTCSSRWKRAENFFCIRIGEVRFAIVQDVDIAISITP
jgi:hypothetical protein